MAAFSQEMCQNHTDLYRMHRRAPVSVQNDPEWHDTVTVCQVGHTGTHIEQTSAGRVVRRDRVFAKKTRQMTSSILKKFFAGGNVQYFCRK